ncbi:MAG TPA: hypothetical protein VMG12_18285 [Polyangiaceae bacterium]|nr:hypothetical protein [Polyangiaceae bacterium]
MQDFSRARLERTSVGAVTFLALLGWGALLGGCQKKDEAKEQAAAKPAATAAAAPKSAAQPSSKPKAPPTKRMEWDDPKQWKKIPASGMRYMSYQIPPVAGEKEIAELNVFVLGGDIESNIQRWVDEFSNFDPKTLSRSDRVVNDMTQAVVEIPKGKFDGGMGEGGATDNFGLLGAIVVTPENSTYFFKLTGPSATVTNARVPFYQLLDSVRLEGGKAAPETAKTIKTVGGAAAPAPVGAAPAAAPSTPAPSKH